MQVAPVLQQVVEAYGCSLVEGVLSHQLKQFVIDGNKCILSKVGTPSACCGALNEAVVHRRSPVSSRRLGSLLSDAFQ